MMYTKNIKQLSFIYTHPTSSIGHMTHLINNANQQLNVIAYI